MNQVHTCSRCGKQLSDWLPDGLCARCMVRDAFETDVATLDTARTSTALQNGKLAHPDKSETRSFGDYELLEEISRGGMGVVYKARQKSLGRLVAVKVILVEEHSEPSASERFAIEAQAAARLQHPNIVAVHDFGSCEGRHYLSMDLVEGGNLHELCAEEPLEPERAARYVKKIAEAIHYAHDQGVLHRDLKPSNILIDPFDNPRITDFGLAKSLATDARLTLSGQTLGTPQYAPPEQVSTHHGQSGAWSDVYSIGGILYQLLTGRPPFVAGHVGDVLQQVMSNDPVAPRVLNPSVPRDLETICLKCLEKIPQRRYATARELAEELSRYLDHTPILARPVGRAEFVWRWCHRRPLVAGLAAALAIALIVGVVGVVGQWRRAVRGELTARQNAYAGDMILVQQSLADGDFGQARALLARQMPHSGQSDLRGWEWQYLWRQSQPDPALRRSLYQHTCAVQNVAVAPDGKWLALSASDGTVATLDLGLGSLQTLQSSRDVPSVVAISPRGDLLAFTQSAGRLISLSTWQEQGRLRLWGVAAAQEVQTFNYEGRILALAFSPNGRFLVTLAIDKTWTNQVVTVWNIQARRRVADRTVGESRGGVTEEAFAISPDGDKLAVGDVKGHVHMLRLPELDRQLEFPAHDETITALAFSPNGQAIASGAGFSDSSVRLWDSATGKAVAAPLVGHRRFVQALAFSPDGKTLASGSADQSIRLWSAATGKSIGVLQGHGQEVWALSYVPDGSGLVSSCKDGSVWLWDTTVPTRLRPAVSTADGVWQFTFMPDGRSGAVVTTDGAVQLRDLPELKPRQSLPDLGDNNWMVAPSSDSTLLAVADRAGRTKVWDLRRRLVLCELPAASAHAIVWAKFAAKNRQLFTASLDSECRVTRWDTATWKQTGMWRCGITPDTGDVSSSGRFVVAGLTNGSLLILDCDSNQQSLLPDGTGIVTAAAFSPDESTLATGSDQGTLQFWSTHSWRPIGAPLRGHRMSIPSLAFSPDGRRLATAGSSGEEAILLWDVATQRTVATLKGDGSRFIWVTFSPDGNTVAAVTRDSGKLHLWRAPDWLEIESAETARIEP